MPIWIEADLCDGCRRCIRACPYDALEIQDGKAWVLERCTACGACLEVCPNSAILSDVEPRKIPDFSAHKGVWVFAEQRDGRLNPVSLELLGKARELAADLGENVSTLLLGHRVAGIGKTLIAHGADNVYLAEHPLLEQFRTTAYARVMGKLIKTHKPSILLLGASHIGRDLAPRLARRVAAGLTADCTDLAIDRKEGILLQTRPAFGGNLMATIANRYSRPQMATVRPGVMEISPLSEHRGQIIPQRVSLGEKDIGTEVLEVVREKQKRRDIIRAKVIVAGGRGAGGAEGFEMLRELADLMGGEVAGTRIAAEQGWIPPENQVGQTGKTVRPEIYIACGISGAIQHRAGMLNARYIIAINTDPRAAIFQIADWSIVGDLRDVVPEMTRQLRRQAEPG